MKAVERELCKAIVKDPHARAEIAGAADDAERVSVVVRLGGLLGLPVAREAVERFFARPPLEEELSDLELEAVVAGKNEDAGKHLVGHDHNWWNDLWDLADDYFKGGKGDDTMEGLGGDDTLWGGEGNDSMGGGEGYDILYGDEGDDTMTGGNGCDVVGGGEGDDLLYGGEGDDELGGGEGHDTLDGGAGDDVLRGWNGNDSIVGGAGNDTLWGEMGNDTLEGGAGDDVLYGDYHINNGLWGNDVFVFGTNDGHDTIINFDSGHDRILLKGIQSPDEIDVSHVDGSTFIVYGETRIELRDVALDKDQVWKLVDGE